MNWEKGVRCIKEGCTINSSSWGEHCRDHDPNRCHGKLSKKSAFDVEPWRCRSRAKRGERFCHIHIGQKVDPVHVFRIVSKTVVDDLKRMESMDLVNLNLQMQEELKQFNELFKDVADELRFRQGTGEDNG